MSSFTLTADGLGLVVPMNVEAMCVNNDKAEFMPAPYNFAKLPNANDPSVPNLSSKVMTEGLTNLKLGVHLHWALPDGLTNGVSPQGPGGSVRFPNVPDRWLINRIHTDLSNPLKPVNSVKSWVIESNFISETPPEKDRTSITVPFKTNDDEAPQYRYMGRVQEYETWREQFLLKKAGRVSGGEENYVGGLSAVGYGSAEFAASYSNCNSIFGFNDIHNDLKLLGAEGADYILSYHVVGWFHELINDPVAQLPVQIDPVPFTELLAKVINPTDKETVRKYYTEALEDGPWVLAGDISDAVRLDLIRIFVDADYDFLTAVLERNRWSLPSGTLAGQPKVTHSLMTGVVGPVVWNQSAEYVHTPQLAEDDVNIAIGNTASEALAALIATLSGNQGQPNVELLLNALQLGQLKGVTDSDELNRIETLMLALHASTYSGLDGGNIWQVSLIPQKDGDQGSGEVTLPPALADELNDLNLLQATWEKNNAEITSMRTQTFMDWYRFMLVLRRGQHDPDHGMAPDEMAEYIADGIDAMDEKIEANKPDKINALAHKIKGELPKEYQLELVQGPRYYQPQEPVVLFQGKKIDPPQRYGGDGRFMADDTLVCRLSTQITTQLTVPKGILGNAALLVFNKDNTPQLPSTVPLDYSEQVHALFTEGCLLDVPVMAALCIAAGATGTFPDISVQLRNNLHGYVSPPLLESIPVATVDAMKSIIAPDDYEFFLTLYKLDGNYYVLQKPVSELDSDEVKRLDYIFVSAAATWGTVMPYAGIAPSEVYFVEWHGNPWLPFSLSWKVTYFPFESIPPDGGAGTNYDPDFIFKKFTLGDVTYAYKGAVPIPQIFQSYSNSIFLTPHAEENFQEQILKFIKAQPDDPLDEELKAILASMKNFPPTLSQSLNGMNSGMIMRNEVLQLQIKDPVTSNFSEFTNVEVKNAVGPMTQTGPGPQNYYNPIRAGVMSIASLTIVDAFGRNIVIDKPPKLIVARDLTAAGLPANYAFLAPRIVQPSRLDFRWLAADNDAIEMNTHPATTPVCGWLQANHLDSSLWLYTNTGNPLGSLILSEDHKRVIWQSVPGGNAFGMHIGEFFESGPGKDVNAQFKKLVLALYNGGDGSYLEAFMRANDLTFTLVQPQNFKQMGSNAVLMGSPIAVAQARLDMGTNGLPAYNQSWKAMQGEVKDGAPRTDNGFTKVKFPVRLGAMEQVNDGLLGYFKAGEYGHYYVLHTDKPTDRVSVPDETNILLALDNAANSQLVTLLFDPRGGVHATCGVLPVKQVDLPPDVYADALEALNMAFLTTPILGTLQEVEREKDGIRQTLTELGLPVPAQGGGSWTWLENDLDKWSDPAETVAAGDKATMAYSAQEIREGWLVLNKYKQ